MTNEEFAKYVSLVCGLLRLKGAQRDAMAAELQDHLQTRTEELRQQGVADDEAVRRALEEFGDAQALAANLAAVAYYRKGKWIMRMTVGSLAVLAGIIAVVVFVTPQSPSPWSLAPSPARAQTATADRTVASSPIADEATEKLWRMLDAPAELDFIDTPLSDAVSLMTEGSGLPLLIDEVALDAAAIDPDETTICFQQTGISLRSALRHILRDLDLTVVPFESQLLITSVERAERMMTVQCHPVWDLLQDPLDSSAAPDYDTLIAAITTNIAPETWEERGGTGSISGYKGTLVVSQQEGVQRQIAQLLTTLHDLPAIHPDRRDVAPKGMGLNAGVAWREKIKALLDEESSLSGTELPLEEALQMLFEPRDVPWLLDAGSLDRSGIAPDEPVSAQLQGLSLKSLLRIVLGQLDLTYILRDEMLVVTTPEEAERQLAIRIYPVAGLIDFVEGDTMRELGPEFDEIVHLLVATVAPETWEEVGGPGAIAPFPNRGTLVVSQTREVHDQLQNCLNMLYRARKSTNVAPAITQRPDPDELILRVYQLWEPAMPRQGRKAAVTIQHPYVPDDAILQLIIEMVEPGSWDGDEIVVRSVPGRLIIKHRRRVHDQILELCDQLSVRIGNDPRHVPTGSRGVSDAQAGFGGGGFF